MKKLMVLSLVLVLAGLATTAMAESGMKYGLGYFRPEAPVGGRVWFSDKVGGDLGIAFDSRKYNVGTEEETKLGFTLDLGVPIVLVGDETTKFFLRPGFTYKSTPGYDTAEKEWISSKDMWISGTLGVEHFFGKMFSLSVGHGLLFKSNDPGTKDSDTSSEITTEAFGLSNIGFHFYFN